MAEWEKFAAFSAIISKSRIAPDDNDRTDCTVCSDYGDTVSMLGPATAPSDAPDEGTQDVWEMADGRCEIDAPPL